MSTYDELNQRLDEADATMRAAEERLGNFRALNADLAGLVGRGAAADGRIAVEWTTGGLAALDLDPRVMRLASADLSTGIRAAVAAAMADLREQTRVLLAASGMGPESAPSRDQVRERLAELRRVTIDSGRRAAQDIDRAEQLRRPGTWR